MFSSFHVLQRLQNAILFQNVKLKYIFKKENYQVFWKLKKYGIQLFSKKKVIKFNNFFAK